MSLQEGESAIQFANRIKSKIAEQGGLVDLEWFVFMHFILSFLEMSMIF